MIKFNLAEHLDLFKISELFLDLFDHAALYTFSVFVTSVLFISMVHCVAILRLVFFSSKKCQISHLNRESKLIEINKVNVLY